MRHVIENPMCLPFQRHLIDCLVTSERRYGIVNMGAKIQYFVLLTIGFENCQIKNP